MNRIQVKELVHDDVSFRLNKTRTLFKLEKILAENGIAGKVPFILFLDEEDKASLKYVKHKLLDIQDTVIVGTPISFTELYEVKKDDIKNTQFFKTLECIKNKYKTSRIPFIVQIPSDSNRFSIFNKLDIVNLIDELMADDSLTSMCLDADYFIKNNDSTLFRKEIDRLAGSALSDTETVDHILSNLKIPATPKGILVLINKMIPKLNLRRASKNFSGLKIALVGCNSKTTGEYLSYILPRLKSTVSLYHSKSIIDKDEFKDYDVVISCVGKLGFIDSEKLGISDFDRILIDVGVSVDEKGKVKGDFNEDVRVNGNHYTPYINGVGLLTRAALLNNIMLTYSYILNKSEEVK